MLRASKLAGFTAELEQTLKADASRNKQDRRSGKALDQHQKRKATMVELELQAKGWAGKLDGQDQGAKKRGRKLSDSGTKACFYHAVLEAHLGKIIKVDMKAELFSYAIDEDALRLAEMMDGKSLADIERGFKVLKSELGIGPVYHRLPERIRAHASICFMALILHRVMRMRLRAAKTGVAQALRDIKVNSPTS